MHVVTLAEKLAAARHAEIRLKSGSSRCRNNQRFGACPFSTVSFTSINTLSAR